MKGKVEVIAQGAGFTAVNTGKFDDLLSHSSGDIKGKLFLKDYIKSTGAEVSFALLPAGMELPFFHSHKQNEEIYIIIKGRGQFQVDGEALRVSEGSVVRLAPAPSRSLKSDDDSDMVFMVIQTKQNSLSQWTFTDGNIEKTEPKWLK